MEYVEIKNFRGIPDVKIPLSQFVCIIGENNSGKSSILLALNIFYSGAKLTESDYFNKEDIIKIGIKFSGISGIDLDRLSDTHKKRIREIVINNELCLSRIYDVSGKSRFHYKTSKPIDLKYSEDNVKSLLKGKSGKNVETEMVNNFPEYSTRFKGITTQKRGKEIIKEIIDGIPDAEKQFVDEMIPTGMDSSIKAFLPEPIFVAAVKDLSDEVKTKQSATFGKLLNFVMSLIVETEKFQDITNSFDELNKLLNSTIEEGENDNGRLEEIIDIERQIEKNLQESFPNIKLDIEIPPPELNQIFSNAQLYVDDGVRDIIETKGDGVKRSMVFSLLRTYVDFQREKEKSEDKANNSVSFRPYMILFEEPELYLHPNNQKILFSALEGLSKSNFIIMTTHAPDFYSPDQIATFVHLRKMYPSDGIPYGVAKSIDLLKEISLRNVLPPCFTSVQKLFQFSEVYWI